MQAMQQDSLSINSYRDNAIMLNYKLENLTLLYAEYADSIFYVNVFPDSLIIGRKLESDSIYTEFIIPYSDTTNFYLDTMIYDTGLYHYKLATKNKNGRSFYALDSINHQLPRIDSLSIGKISCSKIPISWEYNIDVFSDTSGTYDTLKFQIERILLSGSDTTYNIDLPRKTNNKYEFNNDTFDLGTIYEYKIAFQGRAINSLSAVVQKYIPNPAGNVDSLYWIPISSDIMYLNWDIEGDLIYDSIKVNNKISDIPYSIYQNNDAPTTVGYLLDSLSTYSNGITAGQKVQYTLQWFCKEDSTSYTFDAATLPYNNMVYIPEVSNYPYKEISASGAVFDSSISSFSFYIDTYEITENVYNEPNSNTSIEANSFPKDSLSYNLADTFAQNRHPANNSNILCDELSQIEFKIPQDYEWQIASRCQYDWDDWENKTCEQYFDYPLNVAGGNAPISCTFINYDDCCNVDIDCEKSVVKKYPESITPFGLYGTSGNLQEWVENSNSSISANKLIGGNFSSSYDEVTTRSVYYISDDFEDKQHASFGLRTVFYADIFLPIWRECLDPNP